MTVRPYIRTSVRTTGLPIHFLHWIESCAESRVFSARNRMLTRVVAKQAKTTKVKNKFVSGKKSSKEHSVVFLVEGEKFNLGERNSVIKFRQKVQICYGVSNTFCQEKHQHLHADRQLVTKKEISIKINYENNVKLPWPSGLVTGISRRRAGFDTQREQDFFSLFFFNKTTWMRVFLQINNCQQKQNRKTKQKTKSKKQTKQKGGLRF